MNYTDKFRKIANDLADLYERKNHDYGDSFHNTYAKFGIISSATRISDKFNRFCQLATSDDIRVKDEKIEDTLMDLASYSIMTLIELQNGNKKESAD